MILHAISMLRSHIVSKGHSVPFSLARLGSQERTSVSQRVHSLVRERVNLRARVRIVLKKEKIWIFNVEMLPR
jgi:hypothetical protein